MLKALEGMGVYVKFQICTFSFYLHENVIFFVLFFIELIIDCFSAVIISTVVMSSTSASENEFMVLVHDSVLVKK